VCGVDTIKAMHFNHPLLSLHKILDLFSSCKAKCIICDTIYFLEWIRARDSFEPE